MATRIAVLADMHVSCVAGTAQEAALDWALGVLVGEMPDIVVVAGDATAAGTREAAGIVRAKMDEAGLPFRIVPGNSDRRTPRDWEAVCRFLTLSEPFVNDECALIAIDTSDETIPPGERRAVEDLIARAGARQVVLVMHHGPSALKGEDRAWLLPYLESGRIGLVIVGHHHRDGEEILGRAAVHTVRGLDPDKAVGGPPAVTIFEIDRGDRRRREVAWPAGDVGGWSGQERAEFVHNLGFSCMDQTLRGLDEAAKRGVFAVELRGGEALGVDREALLDALGRWRGAGGGYLSVHLPNLVWDEAAQEVRGLAGWQGALDLVEAVGAEAVTVHVPRVGVGDMQPGSRAWEAFLSVCRRCLESATAGGTVVGVENLHMAKGEAADESRGFGYLPEECLGWVRALREATGSPRVGFHLDIGHARNNPPFSKRLALGQWYALVGAEVTGYHIHQVVMDGDDMRNHHPFRGAFGPLISLSSFFWAWHGGQLNHAPVFLEIRDEGTGWESLDVLREFFRRAD